MGVYHTLRVRALPSTETIANAFKTYLTTGQLLPLAKGPSESGSRGANGAHCSDAISKRIWLYCGEGGHGDLAEDGNGAGDGVVRDVEVGDGANALGGDG